MLSSLRMLLANLRLASLAIHKTKCSIAGASGGNDARQKQKMSDSRERIPRVMLELDK